MWMQFLVLLVLAIVYYACWIRQCIGNTAIESSDKAHFSIVSSTVIAVIALLLAFGSLLSVVPNRNYYSVTSAITDIASGDAAQYLAEKEQRMQILEDDSVRDAVFEPHSVRPELLFQNDIYEDASLWENTIVATYYDKDSVRVSK
jgi:type VI protein secretion system component VasK